MSPPSSARSGKLRMERLIAPKPSPERDRVLAMIVARVLDPGSKLAAARNLAEATAGDSLAETLGLGAVDEDQLYAAMDWLLKRQERIEQALARRHLKEGALVLYDLTSVYLEGACLPAGPRRGHSRDGRKGKPQIEFGLLCDAEGRPAAVEVFPGNAADPATVGPQIEKLRARFGLSKVVLVGDRGMLTEARIREEVRPAGLDWIGALRGPAIRKLVEAGTVQLSLFDETDLVEVRSDAYPGERLMVCRNPLLAEERRRKREQLLHATGKLLDPIVAATRRSKTAPEGRGPDRGSGSARSSASSGWPSTSSGTSTAAAGFGYRRNAASINAEAALDGLYVIRTSLPEAELDGQGAVRAYKRLSTVERAFRSLKSVDLKVRPVFHRTAERVRAPCAFVACWPTTWNGHMRRRLAPLLFRRRGSGRRRGAARLRRGPGAGLRIRPAQGPAQAPPTKAGPCTASAPCFGASPPSRRTAWRPDCPAPNPSTSSPGPHRTAARSLPAARRAPAVAYPVTDRRKSMPSPKINMLERIDSGSSG